MPPSWKNIGNISRRRRGREALALLDGGTDPELRELAEQELTDGKAAEERCAEELKTLLLPRDPNDERNVIIEIQGGAGGENPPCSPVPFTGCIPCMPPKRALKPRWSALTRPELGGYKEISFLVTGDGAYSRLKFESGVHRVQRVPETEAAGRIHTSTVTVAVLPEAGRRGGGDQPRRPADRYLSFRRRRGAARKQDRISHPHHPPPHRASGGVSG